MPANINLKLAKFWLPVVLFMVVIFYVSGIPGSNIPSLFPYEDLLYHFLAYFLLGYFFSRALNNTVWTQGYIKIVVLATIFGIIYGLTDEWHQSFVPLRNVSVFDLFIDSVAAFSGSLLFTFRQPALSGRKICLK